MDEDIESLAQLVYQNRAPVFDSYLVRNIKKIREKYGDVMVSVEGYTSTSFPVEAAVALVLTFTTNTLFVKEEYAYQRQGWPSYDSDFRRSDSTPAFNYHYNYNNKEAILTRYLLLISTVLCVSLYGRIKLKYFSFWVTACVSYMFVRLAMLETRSDFDVYYRPGTAALLLVYGVLLNRGASEKSGKLPVSDVYCQNMVCFALIVHCVGFIVAVEEPDSKTYSDVVVLAPVLLLGALFFPNNEESSGISSNRIRLLVAVTIIFAIAKALLGILWPSPTTQTTTATSTTAAQEPPDGTEWDVHEQAQWLLSFMFVVVWTVLLSFSVKDTDGRRRDWERHQTISMFICVFTWAASVQLIGIIENDVTTSLAVSYIFGGLVAFFLLIVQKKNAGEQSCWKRFVKLPTLYATFQYRSILDFVPVLALIILALVCDSAGAAGTAAFLAAYMGFKYMVGLYGNAMPAAYASQRPRLPLQTYQRT